MNESYHLNHLLPRLLVYREYRTREPQNRGKGVHDLVGDVTYKVTLKRLRLFQFLVYVTEFRVQDGKLLYGLVITSNASAQFFQEFCVGETSTNLAIYYVV